MAIRWDFAQQDERTHLDVVPGIKEATAKYHRCCLNASCLPAYLDGFAYIAIHSRQY